MGQSIRAIQNVLSRGGTCWASCWGSCFLAGRNCGFLRGFR